MFQSSINIFEAKVTMEDFTNNKTILRHPNQQCDVFIEDKYINLYYLALYDGHYTYLFQKEIAHQINISWSNYLEIITNCEAFKYDHNFYFKTKVAAQKAIDKLIPFLVMNKLID